jgi:hypothetical protein
VDVDGFPGTPQVVQYLAPGPQKIRLYALSRGLSDRRDVPITVNACPTQTTTLRMLYNQNPFHKNRVDFHAELRGRARGRAYLWYFGDGTTAQTTVPFVSHDYAPSVNPADKYTYFAAFVVETASQLVSGKNIALGSSFQRSRMMGFVQADVTPTVTKTGQGFVVGLDIRNSHKSSIRLNRYFKQYLPCDVVREDARFEDADDVGMLGQPRGEAGLAHEPLLVLGDLRGIGVGGEAEHLDRDPPSEFAVFGFVDDAHAAAAQLASQLVPAHPFGPRDRFLERLDLLGGEQVARKKGGADRAGGFLARNGRLGHQIQGGRELVLGDQSELDRLPTHIGVGR